MTARATLFAAIRGLIHQERLRCRRDADALGTALCTHADALVASLQQAAVGWVAPARPAGLLDAEWALVLGSAASVHLDAALAREVEPVVERVLRSRGVTVSRLTALGEAIDALLTAATPPARPVLAARLREADQACEAALRFDLARTLEIAVGADQVFAALRREGGAVELRLASHLGSATGREFLLRGWADGTFAALFDGMDAHLAAIEGAA